MKILSKIYSRFKNFYLFFRFDGYTLVNKLNEKISTQKEEIDTLYYFLNHLFEIKELPPCKDENLLILQKCDIIFLKIFDIICEKHKINYWLDQGTLLGAVRHKGFIPWDDDIDLAIERKDFNRFMKEVAPEFIKLGIDVRLDSFRIGIGYRHKETGIWIDLCPFDEYFIENDIEIEKLELNKKISSYKNKYEMFKVLPQEQYKYQREVCIGGSKDCNQPRLIYLNPEFFFSKNIIHEASNIFPLKKITFGGFLFPVPNNTHSYLIKVYDEEYNKFPRFGCEKHGSENGPLKTWANKSKINMGDILNDLHNIYNKIKD